MEKGLHTVREVLVNDVLTCSISVVIVERYPRTVNRELLKVRPSMSVELRIEVREDSSLE